MFGSGKKLGKPDEHLLASLMGVKDAPRVIGKPAPTAKDLREMIKEAEAREKIEGECQQLNLNIAKTLDN